ncbi:extracellular metalloprotease [Oceanobacillus oncorhynchi subsp. incaldanensis]|uniref:Serine protease n=1 Tax=Oceanobacillus oncorhynchi TaxID=545501 RepID=A0A0A1MXA5_9BACI|nr:serine protease [Oceanobacillus oncorhynchi]GIO19757.1 extracellular metalloprotease [Oceanobacillus oncorhynchi subsp. incaldanensis]CEI84189.1 Extracellular metalloprotease precursor [Oceanobacillus oncorhynchi]
MKKVGMLFFLTFLLLLFFTGNVLAAESSDSLAKEEIKMNESISYDGESEEKNQNVAPIIQRDSENNVSLPSEGTGNTSHTLIEDDLSDVTEGTYDNYSIIGPDQRTRITNTTAFPNRAVVSLVIQFPNEPNNLIGCSGFLVNEDTVITAGHCVYDHGKGGWAEEVTSLPGRNENAAPYGSYGFETLYTVTGWRADQNSEYDYGAIKLAGAPGNDTGWFGYRTTNAESNPSGLTFNVTGYPCDKPNGTMWTDSGTILSVTDRQLGYDADTYGCQSGSPVHRNYSDTGHTAIAIHAYGVGGTNPPLNRGTRITQDVFDNIQYWSNE